MSQSVASDLIQQGRDAVQAMPDDGLVEILKGASKVMMRLALGFEGLRGNQFETKGLVDDCIIVSRQLWLEAIKLEEEFACPAPSHSRSLLFSVSGMPGITKDGI